MRNAFVDALLDLAAADPDLVLMTGDLGFGVLNEYRERHADQFINVGVAEQNLAGVAAGLAMAGHRVFTYSIGNFPTLRCLEQIRNDICYHGADVCVVTVGGGMAYGALGPSHFAIEDLAILRALPQMTVLSPGDPHEVAQLVPQLVERGGPCYLRLGRAGEPTVHDADTPIHLGEPVVLREGGELALIATGGMLPVAANAAAQLSERHGIDVGLVSVHTLTPDDDRSLRELLSGYRRVISCEEHTVVGGLGGMLAEMLAEMEGGPVLTRLGLPRAFPSGIGSQEWLRTENGLDEDALVRCALERLQVSVS